MDKQPNDILQKIYALLGSLYSNLKDFNSGTVWAIA